MSYGFCLIWLLVFWIFCFVIVKSILMSESWIFFDGFVIVVYICWCLLIIFLIFLRLKLGILSFCLSLWILSRWFVEWLRGSVCGLRNVVCGYGMMCRVCFFLLKLIFCGCDRFLLILWVMLLSLFVKVVWWFGWWWMRVRFVLRWLIWGLVFCWRSKWWFLSFFVRLMWLLFVSMVVLGWVWWLFMICVSVWVCSLVCRVSLVRVWFLLLVFYFFELIWVNRVK